MNQDFAARSGQAASDLGVRLNGAGTSWVMLSDWGVNANSTAWTEYYSNNTKI